MTFLVINFFFILHFLLTFFVLFWACIQKTIGERDIASDIYKRFKVNLRFVLKMSWRSDIIVDRTKQSSKNQFINVSITKPTFVKLQWWLNVKVNGRPLFFSQYTGSLFGGDMTPPSSRQFLCFCVVYASLCNFDNHYHFVNTIKSTLKAINTFVSLEY